MSAFAYMLRCADRSFYVGSARGDTLDWRMGEHDSGALGGYTATRRAVELVWAEQFGMITDAIAFERRIKGWSRAKKEALIRGDWDRVRRLAKRTSVRLPDDSNPALILRSPQSGPRRTHHPRACFEGRLRRPPQHEGR